MNQNPQQIRNTQAHPSVEPAAEHQHSIGCLPARIGSNHAIKTTVTMRAQPSTMGVGAGVLRAGITVIEGVRDIRTASEAELAVMRWVCQNPACRAKSWESSEALLADHASDSELRAQLEVQRSSTPFSGIVNGRAVAMFVHVYFAVAESPYVAP